MSDLLPLYAQRNQRLWNAASDGYQERHGEQLEKSGGTAWGVWQIPEAELQVLGEVHDRDILEFGCGAAQWAVALALRGARMTGIDLSERQLEHARENAAKAGVELSLHHGGAERTPFPDAAFDIVFCDHGAMTFADPRLTVPEAARILRPGGLFAFSHNTPVYELTWLIGDEAPSDRLARDYWALERFDEPGEPTGFQLRYGEWIELFGACGLTVESLIELRPPADALSSYRSAEDLRWARRWPMEQIWRVRKPRA